jgi:phosphate transport system protein
MEDELTQHHISQQFNKELRELRSQVLVMGGLVEEQLTNALHALTNSDEQLAKKVYSRDYEINALEVKIDKESTQILVRRQPTASDLRLVMAVIKTITDLERIGDQAERIAHMTLQMGGEAQAKHFVAISHLGEHVQQMLHDTLDAFARINVEAALQVIREDRKVDSEYDNLSRQLITYMMEDPRAIPIALNILWSARALERIADHSCNICEYVIYFDKGEDVRHVSFEQKEEQVKQSLK